MIPYISCPFVYDRNNGKMPPQMSQPTYMPPVAPPKQEYMPPMPPMPPMQQMPQIMPPVQHPCPYAPMKPNMGNMGNMGDMSGMSMSDMGDMGGMGGMSGMSDMGSMSDMEDMTPRPGDPPAVVTNPTPTSGVLLFKELSGYDAYGNPSGNADILYTGNRSTWDFRLPNWLPAPSGMRGQLMISAVLDDHARVAVNRYSARITVNGSVVFDGRLPLEHGVPQGGPFVNWRLLTFDIPRLTRNNRVMIANTSRTGDNDWIGFDWMELRLFYL